MDKVIEATVRWPFGENRSEKRNLTVGLKCLGVAHRESREEFSGSYRCNVYKAFHVAAKPKAR